MNKEPRRTNELKVKAMSAQGCYAYADNHLMGKEVLILVRGWYVESDHTVPTFGVADGGTVNIPWAAMEDIAWAFPFEPPVGEMVQREWVRVNHVLVPEDRGLTRSECHWFNVRTGVYLSWEDLVELLDNPAQEGAGEDGTDS